MAGPKVRADFLDVLDACILDVRAGRKTVERCLEEFPEHRAELAALLPTAAAIVSLPVTPDPARKLAGRVALVEELHRGRHAAGGAFGFPALRARLLGVAAAA